MQNSELGALIGVGPSMASRIRNGQRLPSARVIRRIHTELGVPLDELMAAHASGAEAFGLLLRERLSGATRARAA